MDIIKDYIDQIENKKIELPQVYLKVCKDLDWAVDTLDPADERYNELVRAKNFFAYWLADKYIEEHNQGAKKMDKLELTPGKPDECQGNGQHPDYECCCDNCDYYLACFPEWAPGGAAWKNNETE